MTGKELRGIARTVIGEQLRAEKFESERTLAALQVLHAPVDPDEEREEHMKLAAMNAKSTGGELRLGRDSGWVGPASDMV